MDLRLMKRLPIRGLWHFDDAIETRKINSCDIFTSDMDGSLSALWENASAENESVASEEKNRVAELERKLEEANEKLIRAQTGNS